METLVSEIDPEFRPHLAELRGRLAETLDTKPTLEWRGLAWHWCEHYTLQSDCMLLELRLIPDPKLPRVAMTLSKRFFEQCPPQKLHRNLQAGLGSASCIGPRVWCEWAVPTPEVAEQLFRLVEQAVGEEAKKR